MYPYWPAGAIPRLQYEAQGVGPRVHTRTERPIRARARSWSDGVHGDNGLLRHRGYCVEGHSGYVIHTDRQGKVCRLGCTPPSRSRGLDIFRRLVRDQAFKAMELFVKKLEEHAAKMVSCITPCLA